jgi:two-component system OmpR family sensor kinase
MKWHVFPEGRMCSIRRALLLWLLPVFVLVGAVSAGLSYWTYCRMVATFMDDQMQQLAQAVAGSDAVQPPRQSVERVFKWGGYVVQAYGADGKLLATTLPELKLPLQADQGFHDVLHEGRAWRV